MRTREGISVRLTDPYRHKYSDAIAEWLDMHPDHEDESTGDTEAPTGYVARFGRTLLVTDSRGFVDRDTCRTEQEARERFADLADEYTLWETGGFEVFVCHDCYFAHHYGYEEIAPAADGSPRWAVGEYEAYADCEPLARLKGCEVSDWCDPSGEITGTERGFETFSSHPCGGCGTHLAGERFRLLAVFAEED